MTEGFTPTEMMTVAASRALKSSDVCFVGIGVGEAREIAGRRRHAEAAAADVGGFDGARRRDRHHFGRGKALGHAAPAVAKLSRWRCSANASGPRSSTFAFIQAKKPSRSREISSHCL